MTEPESPSPAPAAGGPAEKRRRTPPAGRRRPARASALGAARVRMYRQGLGDCFLLSFPRTTGGPFHLLIDCGMVAGVKLARPGIMTEVAADIAETTRDHLHLVVATHAHWDHVSGFLEARTVFDRVAIDEVWLPWTEDPADPLAVQVRAGRERTRQGLRALAGRLRQDHPEDGGLGALAGRMEDLLGFFGTGTQTVQAALQCLTGHPARPRIRYRRPAEPPLDLPGLKGTRTYVLGPGRDDKLNYRGDSSGAGRGLHEIACMPGAALLASFGLAGAAQLTELSQAFEPHLRRSPAACQDDPFFQECYFETEQAWRRIEHDWLEAADQLALNLDSATNGTSLAMAIELQPDGDVLLFPGDAPLGGGTSWDDCRWRGSAGGRVTAADLLRRTVLFKVGHHASPAATPSAAGLERMTSPELVALVPVHRGMADQKGWPGMPFPPLLDRLAAQARGRVLRLDHGLPLRPAQVGQAEWQAFQDRVRVEDLYVDYALPALARTVRTRRRK